ncbi:MAG: MgtC/SapB family protein [Verrucomicrobia bacterium]|nr:MAG: MgtC/SapB family protein [Verrucomicrobiota bacterium]
MNELGTAFEWPVGVRLVLALALGFLVGLERESARADNRRLVFGGVRTFPIVSLLGFACAWLHQLGVMWILPVGLLAVLVLGAMAYAGKLREGRVGATSEVSALLTFLVGAMTLLTDIRLAMALGVVNTILLSEKTTLESFVERVDKVEFLATLRFLLVTFIIYPVLPDSEFTTYQLNPAHIWRMVILVSSIGFVGYFLVKKFGHRAGLWLSGLLGGIVSSTAVSVALGRMVQQQSARAVEALQAALLASSMMYLRVLILIGLFNLALAEALAWRLAALSVLGLLLAASTCCRQTEAAPLEARPSPVHNPFEIRPALIFALLFVALTVLTAWAKTHFGHIGVLSLAGFSGLVDVDPFLLSLMQHPVTTAPLTRQLILVALMSNTMMKGVYFSTLAQPVHRGALLRYLLWAAAHLPLLA